MMDYETISTKYLATGNCPAIRWETCVMCPVADLCGAWIVDPVQIRGRGIMDFEAVVEQIWAAVENQGRGGDTFKRFAEEYHEMRLREAQEIIDSRPHGMIVGGMPGPMELGAQLKRCEAYHEKKMQGV